MPITEIIQSEEEVLDEVDHEELEQEQDDQDDEVIDTETEAGDIEADEEADTEEALVISIDGEEATVDDEAKAAPQWVKELRKSSREKDKRIRDLELQLKKSSVETPHIEPLGKKPSLEEFDYDADRYEAALSGYFERKRKIDDAQENARRAQEQQQQAWQQKLDSYNESKQKLKAKLPDFDEAETAVLDRFDHTQQGIILQGAKNPDLVIYVIGSNPTRVAEFEKIKDPIQFAFAVAQLETKVKTENRKNAPPPPESRPKSDGGAAPSGKDHKLERLMAEAEKTGDRTKVVAYRRSLRK